MGLLTAKIVKKFEFTKSKITYRRHFEKNVKLSYLSKRLTDFDDGTETQICPLLDTDRLYFAFFKKKQDGGSRHLEKPPKLRYHNNRLTDLREIWHDYTN